MKISDDCFVLPINAKPSVITCIHHAYPLGIIESKELATIMINSFDPEEWVFEPDNMQLTVQGEQVIFCEENGKIGHSSAVLWRNCATVDEIIIKIQYFKPRDIGRFIDIFLFSDDLREEIALEDKHCGFRWNQYGYFVEKNMYSFDTKKYVYLKACVEKNVIIGYASFDGMEWELIDRVSVPAEYQKHMRVGIHCNPGKNFFETWKNMNFIQLEYNPDNIWKGIYLDYYFFPRKNVDNSYMYFSHYLDTYYDVIYEVQECFDSLHDYLQWCIRHFYYVNICLDEYYVPGREHYKKSHYDHYNLFFGFDNKNKKYYLMGYASDNKPTISEVSYEELNLSKNVKSEKIIRYKLFTNDNTNLIPNLSVIKNGLIEFVNSVDSSQKVANLLSGEPLIYGIEIFRFLAENDLARHKIRIDQRISFCIYEHAKLMQQRIEYLRGLKVINESDYHELKTLADEIIKNATIVMALVLKNMTKLADTSSIEKYLQSLYSLEKKLGEDLIRLL